MRLLAAAIASEIEAMVAVVAAVAVAAVAAEEKIMTDHETLTTASWRIYFCCGRKSPSCVG